MSSEPGRISRRSRGKIMALDESPIVRVGRRGRSELKGEDVGSVGSDKDGEASI